MAKQVYAAVITSTPDGFVVNVPDLTIGTQGDSLAEAIDMARDAIGIYGISMQEIGQEIPEPAELNPAHAVNELIALIDIDFDAYRQREENRTVRKNCTIPNWMNEEAERRHINFSQVLQEALRQQLSK